MAETTPPNGSTAPPHHTTINTTAITEPPKAPPQSNDITLNLTTVGAWLGFVLLVLTLIGMIGNFFRNRRKEDQAEADKRLTVILKTIDDNQGDVDKELKKIETLIEHNNNGSKQRDLALQHQQEKIEGHRSQDFERLVKLENTIGHMKDSIAETKTMVKESREELNRKLDVLLGDTRKPAL